MELKRLSVRCREALAIAQAFAVERGHEIVTGDHLLLALLRQPDGLAPYLLAKSDSGRAKLTCLLEMRLARIPSGVQRTTWMGADIESLFLRSFREADQLGSRDVSVGHLLIVFSEAENQCGTLLRASEVTRGRILFEGRALDEVPSALPVREECPTLLTYGRDLTREAALGKLDPVIGREDVVQRVLQLLLRRAKNNPILVGEPGVGKTAVAESIAERIVRGDVPDSLKGKTLIAIDLGAMIAGTQYRGMFESRVKAVVREASDSRGRIILFVDEAHTLVGGGAAIGTPDAANLLKPALARGEFRVIAATTTEEYRRYFARDAALERRFQPVYLEEPDLDRTVSILRGLRGRYEAHHGVRILDEALVAAADLSVRFVMERRLPDKAIDLMDEAAAERRMESDRLPAELQAMERRIIELESERGEGMESALLREIAELRTAAGWLRARWQQQKEACDHVRNLRRLIAELSRGGPTPDEKRRAALRGQLLSAEASLPKSSGALIRETVTGEDVANVVSRWSGVPVTRLLEGEARKLAGLEDRLRQSVVGQPEAARVVAGAILRARSGVKSAARPVGSFLFLGPSGVGKTEMAKSLARHLFGDENRLVRIQMSDLSQPGSVTRLVGAPPGYIGYEDGGMLTEAVRKRPYSIVLFDELEKAHRDVHNLLLQVLDEGRLNDSRGRPVDFRNTLMILTSNLGSSSSGVAIGFGKHRRSDDALEKHCSPELINRFDAVVEFQALTPAHMLEIVEIQTGALTERLAERSIALRWTTDAKRWLAERGYDPTYGARPLRRLLEGEVESALARGIVQGRDEGVVTVSVSEDGICLIDGQGDPEQELSSTPKIHELTRSLL